MSVSLTPMLFSVLLNVKHTLKDTDYVGWDVFDKASIL